LILLKIQRFGWVDKGGDTTDFVGVRSDIVAHEAPLYAKIIEEIVAD